MKCPTCKDINLVITERKEIEIDYCPECRGIWLDRGELDKILERTREPQAPIDTRDQQQYPQQPYQQPHQPPMQQGYYQKPYKKKKSFLEELFD